MCGHCWGHVWCTMDLYLETNTDIAVSTTKHEFFGVAMSVIKYFNYPLLVFNVCVPDSGWKQWPAAAIHSVQTDWCIQKSIPVSCWCIIIYIIDDDCMGV